MFGMNFFQRLPLGGDMQQQLFHRTCWVAPNMHHHMETVWRFPVEHSADQHKRKLVPRESLISVQQR
ncbi:hypothetical protein AOLI_G00237350 [Acnodon oligacanthus]